MCQEAVESSIVSKINTPKEIRQNVLKLAWPSIAEQVLIMLVGMVSLIFVGRIGKEAITAVGMVNTLLFFFQSVFAALGTGTTVVVARLYGEGDEATAREAALQALILTIIASMIIVVPGYLLEDLLFKLFFGAAEPAVMEYTHVYYIYIMAGIPFVLLNIVICSAFRGAGDTRTPMLISAIVNVVNIAASGILIFGLHLGGHTYIPALGVKGAGIGALIARLIGGTLTLVVLFWGRGIIKLTLKERLRFNVDIIRRILKVGLPASLEQVVMQGGFLMMQSLVVSMGTVVTAVYQISMNINSLAFMPILGFAIAVTTLVGQSLGKKNSKEAEQYANETVKISVVLISTIGFFMFIFSRQLVSLYTIDPEVIAIGSNIIKIFACIEPFLALMNIYSAVLRGAGDIVYTTYTSLVGLWTFRLALSYILHKFFGMGVYGIWIGISLDFIVRALMYWRRYCKGKWKYIKV